MLWIHPVLQSLCLLIAVHVLHMGINRFRFQHLKQKASFNWKRHVLFGKVVNWTWLVGMVLGVYMSLTRWGTLGLTGGHYTVGVLMAPLIVFSLVTGFILQKPSGKRPGLALTHGVANTALFLLALSQLWSGIEVVRLFLLE